MCVMQRKVSTAEKPGASRKWASPRDKETELNYKEQRGRRMVPGSLGRSEFFGVVGPGRAPTQPPLLGRTPWNRSHGQGRSAAGSLENRPGALSHV